MYKITKIYPTCETTAYYESLSIIMIDLFGTIPGWTKIIIEEDETTMYKNIPYCGTSIRWCVDCKTVHDFDVKGCHIVILTWTENGYVKR
jgi:hypothetical protein